MNIPRYVFTLAVIIATAALLAFAGARHVSGQVPACLVEGTPVPCPTPTVTPPVPTVTPTVTPVPPTPIPAVPPQVRLYQTASCGNPVVQADFLSGNSIWRVVVTRNGVVATNPLDLFASVPAFYTDTVAAPGNLYRVYAFPWGQQIVALPGTIFDAPAGVVASFTAFGVPPCSNPTVAAPVAPAVPTPSLSEQIVAAVRAAQPPPVAAQLPGVGAIRPPATGSGGLAAQ